MYRIKYEQDVKQDGLLFSFHKAEKQVNNTFKLFNSKQIGKNKDFM